MTKLERARQLCCEAKSASADHHRRAADCRAAAAAAHWASERSVLGLRAGRHEEDAELAALEAEMYSDLVRAYESMEQETI